MLKNIKKQLFNLLTNNQTKTQSDDNIEIRNFNSIESDDFKKYIPDNVYYFKIEGIVACNESMGNYSVAYGGYSANNSVALNGYGWICLLDGNGQPIKSFTEYSNGTKLRYIQKLIITSDDTIVAIDSEHNPRFISDIDVSRNSRKRFIMLNNFINSNVIYDDYILVLNKSYTISYPFTRCYNIVKSQNSSTYVLVCQNYTQSGGFLHESTKIIKFQINVGSDNEWKFWETSTSSTINYLGSYVLFDSDDNLTFRIVTTAYKTSSTLLKIYDNNNDSLAESVLTASQYESMQIEGNPISQCIFKNKNHFYYTLSNFNESLAEIDGVISGDGWERVAAMYEYKNGEIKNVFVNSYGKSKIGITGEQIDLAICNNEVYVFRSLNEESDIYKYRFYFSKLIDNVLDFKLLHSLNTLHIYSPFNHLLIKSNYNLLTFQLFEFNYPFAGKPNGYFYNFKEVYNPNNYNGSPYIDDNCLLPNSSIIESNNQVLFARNLYNKTVNDNITVSTIEIPNTYLNDIDIDNRKLISETNLCLVENTEIFNKNIYETVYLNFINSLLIQDKNNLDHIKNNLDASSYLNQQINTTSAYENARLYKNAIIYYEDSTVEEIGYTFQDRQDTSVSINLLIYIPKLINKIELISDDKQTVYQTIDASNLEVGKLYKINQKLEVV